MVGSLGFVLRSHLLKVCGLWNSTMGGFINLSTLFSGINALKNMLFWLNLWQWMCQKKWAESGCYFSKIFNRAYTLLMNLWHAAWGALVYCLHSMPVLIHFPHYVKLLLNIFKCNNILKAILSNILIHKTCKKGSCTLPH